MLGLLTRPSDFRILCGKAEARLLISFGRQKAPFPLASFKVFFGFGLGNAPVQSLHVVFSILTPLEIGALLKYVISHFKNHILKRFGQKYFLLSSILFFRSDIQITIIRLFNNISFGAYAPFCIHYFSPLYFTHFMYLKITLSINYFLLCVILLSLNLLPYLYLLTLFLLEALINFYQFPHEWLIGWMVEGINRETDRQDRP